MLQKNYGHFWGIIIHMKNFLKSVGIIFCVLLFQLACFAKNEGITIISDTHLSGDKQNNQMTPSVDKLLKAVYQANADTSDCVVFLGDNVQSANRLDVALFAKIIKRLKKPYYVVVGNRDISKNKNMDKKEYYRIINKFSSNKIKKLPTYKKQGDFIFVFLSGVNETFPTYKGYYKQSELDFLDSTLSSFKDKKVVIFQHFPVVPPGEDETRQTVKPELYLDVLAKHDNVLAVVSGHYHKENVTVENGIRHISAGALFSKGEYEQIKIFKNKNGTYTVTTKILSVE